MTSLTALSEQEWATMRRVERSNMAADAVAWVIMSTMSVLHALWYVFLAWTLGGISP
jgi:hypothetical protein